jgi:hypothetical protein
MLRTGGRTLLALVFAGLGYAVLHRRDVPVTRANGDGWVELTFDGDGAREPN